MVISFLLKKYKENVSHIYIALYEKNETALVSTGFSIDPTDWDKKTNRPKQNAPLSAHILEVLSDVIRVYNQKVLIERVKHITVEEVKIFYLDSIRVAKKNASELAQTRRNDRGTISAKFDQFLEANQNLAPNTRKALRGSFNQFLDFLKKSKLGRMEVGTITTEIIRSYYSYLHKSVRLANSSHGKRIKHLRLCLRPHTPQVDWASVKVLNNKHDIIFLTEHELKLLENYDASRRIRHQKAKDLFLLGCYTGLRVSDLQRINSTTIEKNCIKLQLQKTKRDYIFPIRPETMEILKRHGMRCPKINSVRANVLIKEVAREAKINTMVSYTKNVAGVDRPYVSPKCELLSSHIAGKTFISTVAPLRFGLTPPEVANIVEKSLVMLLRFYQGIDKSKTIEKILNA